ncbi:hypothetical protein Tco_1044329 [Tanacetum coccineum]|uniref:Retroviral polymerase SH3-like domain-containing protein n=1 Tax=Tanacetum coccineum TaxID=301880 RepID=A0ABQ5GQ60_9ASTR
MTGAKFDIEKFDRTSDFGLWRIKRLCIIKPTGCASSFGGSYETRALVDTLLYGWDFDFEGRDGLTLIFVKDIKGKCEVVVESLGREERNGVVRTVFNELKDTSSMDKLQCLLIRVGIATRPYGRMEVRLQEQRKKSILLGYPDGVKGYRLYRLDDESPKIVTSRNMVFNESVMYKDKLKDSGAGIDKSVEELQVLEYYGLLTADLLQHRKNSSLMYIGKVGLARCVHTEGRYDYIEVFSLIVSTQSLGLLLALRAMAATGILTNGELCSPGLGDSLSRIMFLMIRTKPLHNGCINLIYHREYLEVKMVKVFSKDGYLDTYAMGFCPALTKVVPGLKLQHCLELLNVGIG